MVYCFAFKRVLRNVKRPFKRRGYKILSYSKVRLLFNKEEKGKNITNILSVTSVQPTVIELQCYKIVVSTSSIAL